jgi:hypothetical protein
VRNNPKYPCPAKASIGPSLRTKQWFENRPLGVMSIFSIYAVGHKFQLLSNPRLRIGAGHSILTKKAKRYEVPKGPRPRVGSLLTGCFRIVNHGDQPIAVSPNEKPQKAYSCAGPSSSLFNSFEAASSWSRLWGGLPERSIA